MAIPHFRYSFANGFNKMTLEDARKAKQELYAYMRCTAEPDYSRKKNRFRDIPKHIYDGITRIFEKYGIPEQDVWVKTEIKP